PLAVGVVLLAGHETERDLVDGAGPVVREPVRLALAPVTTGLLVDLDLVAGVDSDRRGIAGHVGPGRARQDRLAWITEANEDAGVVVGGAPRVGQTEINTQREVIELLGRIVEEADPGVPGVGDERPSHDLEASPAGHEPGSEEVR